LARADWNAWYKSRRWKKLRLKHLKKEPYCQCPHHKGKMVEGNVVDHIKPHKGDTRLFWDENNLQTLTKPCHDKFKQSEERGGRGFNQGCDVHGNPLNDLDHWK
jgi:5-methylcytosine-specific restriction enzyme A